MGSGYLCQEAPRDEVKVLPSVRIEPDGHALETMERIERGPYDYLDAALAEIEMHKPAQSW